MSRRTECLMAVKLCTLAVLLAWQFGPARVEAKAVAPSISTIAPKTITAGGAGFTIMLQGTFHQGDQLVLDGAALPSSRVVEKDKVLLAEVDPSVVAAPGTHSVVAMRPSTGESSQETETLTVVASDPNLFIRLGGNAAQAGLGQDLTITIFGGGFTADSVAQVWGFASPSTIFADSSRLIITLPSNLLRQAAQVPIMVRNKGTGFSNYEIFFLIPPPAVITSLNPDTLQVGTTSATIRLHGTNINTHTAVLVINDVQLPLTLVKDRLEATVPADLLATPGQLVVSILQDGVESAAATLAVTPTAGPFIFTLAPAKVREGLKKPAVTIVGANFDSKTTATIDGQAAPVKEQTKRRLAIVLPDALRTAPGPHTLQVTDKSGQLSNTSTFEVVPDTTVSTIARGFGFKTSCVPLTQGQFRGPRRLTLGPDGLVYIADQLNNAIESLDPVKNELCTVAGGSPFTAGGPTGLPGYNDSGNSRGFPVSFSNPNGLVVAGDGTIYVTENGNSVIRRIVRNSDGSVTVDTFAGTSTPVTNKTLQDRFDSTQAGVDGSADGPARQAFLRQPDDIVIAKDGTFYFSDASTAVIRRIRQTPAGPVVETIAGSGVPSFADGIGAKASFNNPTGIALSPDQTLLYVADFGNNRIRTVNLSTFAVETLAGSGNSGEADGPPGEATFNAPIGLAVDADGTIYVSDLQGGTIRRVDPDGNVNTLSGNGSAVLRIRDGDGIKARFQGPKGITIDIPNRILYVADFPALAIRKIVLPPL
ncbi:MAG TPA: IPT/TIG domain-containing protein [Blastocatellia bacterium]|nr:IPT/TIG domain-containing protein [Blastocatellia bacterium]